MSSPRAIMAQRARDAAKGKEVSIGRGRTAKVGTIAEQKHVGKCPKRGERRYTRDGQCKPLASTRPPCPPYSEAVGGRCMAIVHSQTPAARAARGEKRSPRSVADDSSSSSDDDVRPIRAHMSKKEKVQRMAELLKTMSWSKAVEKLNEERKALRTRVVTKPLKVAKSDDEAEQPVFVEGEIVYDPVRRMHFRVAKVGDNGELREIGAPFAGDVKYVFTSDKVADGELGEIRKTTQEEIGKSQKAEAKRAAEVAKIERIQVQGAERVFQMLKREIDQKPAAGNPSLVGYPGMSPDMF